MGAVYKAKQVDAGRIVALKIIQSEQMESEELKQRFLRECSALSKLSSKHIITFYHAAISDDGQPYAAFEHLEGQTLRQILSSEGKLSTYRTIHIAQQISEAISNAHSAQIIHRDLKPENIMIQQAPEVDWVKVFDFGLSKDFEFKGRESQRLTLTGDLVGTASYMSPEQCEGRRVDQRSDIYALGCIIYECLAGKKLFDADFPMGVIHMQATENAIDKVNELSEFCPPALLILLSQMLAKNPEDRPQDLASVMGELQNAKNELAGGVSSAQKISNPAKSKKKTHLLLILSSFLIPTLGIAGILFWVSKEKKEAGSTSITKQSSKINRHLTNQKNLPRSLELLDDAKMAMGDHDFLLAEKLAKQALDLTDFSKESLPVRFKSAHVAAQAQLASQRGGAAPYIEKMREVIASPEFAELKKRKKAKWKLDYLLAEAQNYAHHSQFEKSVESISKYEQISSATGNDDEEPMMLFGALITKGHAYRCQRNYAKSVEIDERLLAIARKMQNVQVDLFDNVYPSLIADYCALAKDPSIVAKSQAQYLNSFEDKFSTPGSFREGLMKAILSIEDRYDDYPRYHSIVGPLALSAWKAAEQDSDIAPELRIRALQQYYRSLKREGKEKLSPTETVRLANAFLKICKEGLGKEAISFYVSSKVELARDLESDLKAIGQAALAKKVSKLASAA